MNFKNVYQRCLNLWYLLPVIYLLVVTFPGNYVPVNAGLDPSWRYAINYLPYSGYLFGRDLAFTYGPLGYLLAPLNVGSNLMYAVSLWLLIHGVFGAILCYYFYKAQRIISMFLFIVAYIIASISLSYDYHLLIIAGLLLCISIERYDRISWIAAILNGLLASLLLFMKLNLGLAAYTMTLAYFLVLLVKRHQLMRLNILLNAGSCLLMTNIIALVLFKNYANFVAWLYESFDIANGYSIAMSYLGSKKILLLGLLIIIVFCVLIFLLVKKQLNLRYAAVVFIGPIIFSFKHGFVRQDGHVVIFFSFILAVSAVLVLAAASMKELKLSIISLIIVLCLGVPVFNHYNYYQLSVINEIIGEQGWSNIYSLFNFDDVRLRLDREARVNLEQDHLPDALLAEIGGGSVEVLPSEIAYCPANNLSCSLNPLLQEYSAYSSRLDQWCARHYTENGSPDFIIVEFTGIDGRHLIMDAPAMWREISDRYQVAWRVPDRGILLLRKKLQLSKDKLDDVGHEYVLTDQWISVPASDKPLFAGIDMRLSLLGTAVKTVFRIPPVYIRLVYDSGKSASFRIIPETAADGLLINYLPLNLKEMADLLDNRSDDRVARFKIYGPGVFYYNKKLDLQFMESSRSIAYLQGARIDPGGLGFMGKKALYSLDAVKDQILMRQKLPLVFDSRQDDLIAVSGWAVDENAGREAGGVFLDIDGKLDIPVCYGLDRRDVAGYFKQDNYRYSGFSGSFATASLSKGAHTLSVKVVTADKKGYYQTDQKVDFRIE